MAKAGEVLGLKPETCVAEGVRLLLTTRFNEFRGFREDVWGELRDLDVLVHCSVMPEPFGQVVLEGMAAGVPVVASAAGGPAELVTSGVDGTARKPASAATFANGANSASVFTS